MAGSLSNIPESQASGEIARLYADIKDTLRVPAVNLIWRHLATIGGALPWIWGSIKPLYVKGILDAEAEGLRDVEGLPTLPCWPRAALRVVGVRSADETVLRAVLANYDQTNPVNLLAFITLLARLRDEGAERAEFASAPRIRPARITNELPRLIPAEEMSADTRELARAFIEIGLDKAPEWISASAGITRHLANWPGFLALCVSALAPLNKQIQRCIGRVHERAGIRGRALVSELSDLHPPQETGPIISALEPFTERYMIASIIPKVRLLLRALPREGGPCDYLSMRL